MSEIKKTLRKMKIHHDEFVSVQTLIDNCDIESILNKLSEQNLIYYGEIDEKAEVDLVQEKIDQDRLDVADDKFLLFRTTQFDDDKDRVLLRKDGSLTYFAGDLIYHKNKIDRGFDRMILLLGEDHKGYEKRMKAIVKSLKKEAEIDIVLTNLVKFQKNGEEIKMSKRSGSFVKTEDVLSEIPIDVLRFIILSYKRNTNIAFDLEKSITQTAENPVFYVQYGYSRICSLLRKIEEQFAHFKSIESFDEIDRINLKSSDFHNLDKIFSKIIFYPEAIRQSVKQFDPSVLISYVIDLSALFHSAWNFGTENNIKFITESEKENFKNYIILKSIRSIIFAILEIFKIEAMEKM
jgi:arginyl-tRNA synthetase